MIIMIQSKYDCQSITLYNKNLLIFFAKRYHKYFILHTTKKFNNTQNIQNNIDKGSLSQQIYKNKNDIVCWKWKINFIQSSNDSYILPFYCLWVGVLFQQILSFLFLYICCDNEPLSILFLFLCTMKSYVLLGNE